jgi:hypothetical protein
MRVRVLGTRSLTDAARDLVSRVVRPRSPVERVERCQTPYWQERGWTRDGRRYSGAFRTPVGSFVGFIEERGSAIDFYMHDPPPAMRSHSHWACFQQRDSGWYLVHMRTRPADVSSGILTIERLLTEALLGK